MHKFKKEREDLKNPISQPGLTNITECSTHEQQHLHSSQVYIEHFSRETICEATKSLNKCKRLR